jgi:phage FluMu protein Com
MPYLRCPSCGLLAHAVAAVAVSCPRCRALQRQVELQASREVVPAGRASLTHQTKPVR